MKVKDWTHLFPKYAGKWVAFQKDEQTVIAADKSLKKVLKKAQSDSDNHPAVFKVPSFLYPYVGQI